MVRGQFLYQYIILINTDAYINWYWNSFVSGVVENAQDIADDKNNVESSSDNEIVHVNKRAIRSQEEKTSDMEHNEVTGEQKSHISAIKEGEAKEYVSDS